MGKRYWGLSFGSTRIKAVLVDDNNKPIASGAHDWENRLENGIWTYSLDDIWTGLQDCYKKLTEDVQAQYGENADQNSGANWFQRDDARLYGFQ